MVSSFETERLHVRLTTVEDASFICELMNTPKWLQFIGDRNINAVEDAARYIKERMLPQVERLGYGNYTVTRKEDRKKLGTVGLYDREGLEGVDIGFAFLPDSEGQGYAYEASSALKEIAQKDFELTTIHAITLPENKASQRLLEKLGLSFKERKTLPNDAEELMLYSWKKEQ